MLVPVMEIRDVGMRVGDRLVVMGVGVPDPRRQPGMNVRVVTIVVAMAVGVAHCLVHMLMLVAGGEHQVQAEAHEQGGNQLERLNRLSKRRPCQHHSKEWRGREEQL